LDDCGHQSAPGALGPFVRREQEGGRLHAEPRRLGRSGHGWDVATRLPEPVAVHLDRVLRLRHEHGDEGPFPLPQTSEVEGGHTRQRCRTLRLEDADPQPLLVGQRSGGRHENGAAHRLPPSRAELRSHVVAVDAAVTKLFPAHDAALATGQHRPAEWL
jgi:hypothetical protein